MEGTNMSTETNKVRTVFNELMDKGYEFTTDDLAKTAEVERDIASSYVYYLHDKKCCERINYGDTRRGAAKYRKLKDEKPMKVFRADRVYKKYKVAPQSTLHPIPIAVKPGNTEYTPSNAIAYAHTSTNTDYSIDYKPIHADSTIIANQIVELVNSLKEENKRLFSDNKRLVIDNTELVSDNKRLVEELSQANGLLLKYRNELVEVKKSNTNNFRVEL
jgi:hypothetical protein